MAKVNKEFQWRMEGMLYALKIVKEKSIEALEREIRIRGILKLDIWTPKDYIETMQKSVSENVYCSMLSTMLFTIHDIFGFGKERLYRLKKAFDKNVGNIYDLDWMGEHYVRFEDYAVYLNEHFGFDLNADKMAALQDLADEQDDRIGRYDPKVLIAELKANGFDDAAEWLESKVNKIA